MATTKMATTKILPNLPTKKCGWKNSKTRLDVITTEFIQIYNICNIYNIMIHSRQFLAKQLKVS